MTNQELENKIEFTQSEYETIENSKALKTVGVYILNGVPISEMVTAYPEDGFNKDEIFSEQKNQVIENMQWMIGMLSANKSK